MWRRRESEGCKGGEGERVNGAGVGEVERGMQEQRRRDGMKACRILIEAVQTHTHTAPPHHKQKSTYCNLPRIHQVL